MFKKNRIIVFLLGISISFGSSYSISGEMITYEGIDNRNLIVNESIETEIVSVNGLDELSFAVAEISEKTADSNRLIVQSELSEIDCLDATEVIEGYNDIHILQFDTKEDAQQAYNYYSNLNEIDAVDFDCEFEITSDYISWGYGDCEDNNYATNIDEFIQKYEQYFTQSEVVVAIVDTGISDIGTVFKDSEGNSRILEAGYNASTNSVINDIYDDNGHGTHIAGIVAEATPDNVKLMSAKVMDNAGKGSELSLYLGIRYAIENQADVINLSVCSNRSYKENKNLEVLDNVIKEATDKGIVVCAAAGNNAKDASVSSPSNAPTAITVGATNKLGEICSFSNYGKVVDIFAPGENIASVGRTGEVEYRSGTSQATPHVSASVALLKLIDEGLNWENCLEILQRSGTNKQANTNLCNYYRDNIAYENYRLLLGQETLNGYDIPDKYIVYFDYTGGFGSKSQMKVTVGGKYRKLPTATKSGYIFQGWYTSKEGGINITDNMLVDLSDNQNLYAQWADTGLEIYRLYNPITGEHLYTTDANEKNELSKSHGWKYEGIGWYAPHSGTPVYRLYNPVLANHLYTTDANEVKVLTTKHGWVSDNNGNPLFYSGGNTPIYRVYNEGLKGMHHLTTDINEYDTLPKYGWKQEGISIKALKR